MYQWYPLCSPSSSHTQHPRHCFCTYFTGNCFRTTGWGPAGRPSLGKGTQKPSSSPAVSFLHQGVPGTCGAGGEAWVAYKLSSEEASPQTKEKVLSTEHCNCTHGHPRLNRKGQVYLLAAAGAVSPVPIAWWHTAGVENHCLTWINGPRHRAGGRLAHLWTCMLPLLRTCSFFTARVCRCFRRPLGKSTHRSPVK